MAGLSLLAHPPAFTCSVSFTVCASAIALILLDLAGRHDGGQFYVDAIGSTFSIPVSLNNS
jgi:hypothetical protein